MAKLCDVCGVKLGFLSAKYELKDGMACDPCLSPLAISEGGLTEVGSKIANLKNISLENVKIAATDDAEKWEELRGIVYAGIAPKNEVAQVHESESIQTEIPQTKPQQSKKRSGQMLLVNTETIPGKNIELLGIVKGSTVESNFRGFFGAGAGMGDPMFETSYAHVNDLMEAHASELGADAVINVRYSLGSIPSDDEPAMILLASGTAVKFV
jgi:uncharacterized protein YbjQ (UPF0145 family)